VNRRRPRWRERSRLIRLLRLARNRHPQSFTDKVRFKMLRDRRALIVTFADKAGVRDYVAERIGERYLPASYGIVDDPRDLLKLDLPDR